MEPENKNDIFGDLNFDATAIQHIRSITSWALVIVVVALISYGLSLIQVFTAPEVSTVRSEGFDFDFKINGSGKGGTIITILIGLLVNFFLYRFATQARTGLNGLNQSELNKSFGSLKVYFMITSILCMLVFLLFILAIATLSTV
jgi:hypothetical protein